MGARHGTPYDRRAMQSDARRAMLDSMGGLEDRVPKPVPTTASNQATQYHRPEEATEPQVFENIHTVHGNREIDLGKTYYVKVCEVTSGGTIAPAIIHRMDGATLVKVSRNPKLAIGGVKNKPFSQKRIRRSRNQNPASSCGQLRRW
jgi:hypothetical protein